MSEEPEVVDDLNIDIIQRALEQYKDLVPWWTLVHLRTLGYMFKPIDPITLQLISYPDRSDCSNTQIHDLLVSEGKDLYLRYSRSDSSILYKRWLERKAPIEEGIVAINGMKTTFRVAKELLCSSCSKKLVWDSVSDRGLVSQKCCGISYLMTFNDVNITKLKD